MREPITPREAALRAAAIACLAALALVQLAGLPYARGQGAQIAALSAALIAVAVRLAVALAGAGTAGGRATWRAVAALGALVLGGWVATRALAVPGVAEDAGRWTSVPGLAGGAAGAALLALGAAGGGVAPVRRTARALATAVGVVAALAPGTGVLLAALALAPAHQHGAVPTAAWTHAVHARAVSAASRRSFRPGFGGHAGHYVYANATPPRVPAWALALALGAAAALVSLAAGSLRRRVAPAPDRASRGRRPASAAIRRRAPAR